MATLEDLERRTGPGRKRGVGNFFKGVETHVQSRTISGLMELVPLLVTVIVIVFFIGKTDDFVRHIPYLVEGRPWSVTGIGLVVTIILFYLVGLMISNRSGRKLMDGASFVLNLIPIVRTVYGVTQQAAASMSSQYGFTRVVFLEWPREGILAIGFVTGRAYSHASHCSLAVIYVPTVPNPTSGNLALVNEDDLIETDLTVEGAMKLVFSGGIVLPPTIVMARAPREEGERTDMDLIGLFETYPR